MPKTPLPHFSGGWAKNPFREIEEEGEIALNPELLGLFSPYRKPPLGLFSY